MPTSDAMSGRKAKRVAWDTRAPLDGVEETVTPRPLVICLADGTEHRADVCFRT